MLKRVLEPEVMDSLDEARDYDAMDHAEVNRRFVDDFLGLLPAAALDEPQAASLSAGVLDLGTGTAQIPIELCGRLPKLRVMAVDLSEGMLDVARMNVEIAGLIERVVLDRIDAKALPQDDGFFAAVISNSLVHHVAEPREVLAEALRVTAPGGLLFFRDLLRPPDDAAVKRLVYQYAGDETPRQQKMFDDSLRAALSLHEIREIITALRFAPKCVSTTSDRHWTFSARRR